MQSPRAFNLKYFFLLDELAILQELADSYVIDLRNFLPVGPIINLGLYKIPPQPKKVKAWTIIQSKIKFFLLFHIYIYIYRGF